MYCDTGAAEAAWNHYQFALQLNIELAEIKSDPIKIESKIKVKLGISLLQLG